jgi:hypothetical protein
MAFVVRLQRRVGRRRRTIARLVQLKLWRKLNHAVRLVVGT